MAGEVSECLEHHVQGPEGVLCAWDRCQQHAHKRERENASPTGYLVGSVSLSL